VVERLTRNEEVGRICRNEERRSRCFFVRAWAGMALRLMWAGKPELLDLQLPVDANPILAKS
jgi:hypothetical protein